MKKVLTLLLVCINIILAGCVNADLTVDIDARGNMNMLMKVLANDNLANRITYKDLKNIKKEYKIDSLEKISENNQSGYLMTKQLGNIKDRISKTNQDIKNNRMINIIENKGFVFNTYDITLKLKDLINGDVSKEKLSMINLIGNSANMSFHIKSPFKLLDSNATSIQKEEDGRTTYTWSYTLKTLDNINIKFKVPNFTNISIIMGVIILIIISCFIFIIRKNKHK